MSGAKAFLDTNIFVYLYSDTDAAKKDLALRAMNRYERYISTQVLNEFCNVCLRKLRLPIASIRAAIEEIRDTCNQMIADDETVMGALQCHERYGYSYYDSLIVAAALESGCDVLLSEDMANGQVIDGKLTIRNIFADEKP